MVADDHVYVWPFHNVLQYLYAMRISVDHIAENIHRVLVRELDQFQHILPFEDFTVNLHT